MKFSATYPFVQYRFPDGSVRERAELPLRIVNPHGGVCCDAWALLDTGADTCVIPRITSDALGHGFNVDGVQSTITGGIGGKSPTYKHTFSMELYTPNRKDIAWSSGNILVDCIDADLPVLLGVNNFLRHFEVCINYPKKTITLSWN